MTKTEQVLLIAKEVLRLEAALEEAKSRLASFLEERTPMSIAPRKPVSTGKMPNPDSINQRVLAAFAAGPRSVESIAKELAITPQQARHAIVYHQKHDRVTHTGDANTYDLKVRSNGSAEHPAQLDLQS